MDFNALALECAPMVSPKTLAAIVRTESNFNPLAININKGYRLERQPKNKEEAVATAQWLINNRYNIDMGLGQVNSVNLAKTKLSVNDAFDPCKNLSAAATILKWNFDSASKKIPGDQQALHAAISAYNTGSFTRGFSNGYVQKVVNSAKQVTSKIAITSVKSDIKPIKLIASNPVTAHAPVTQAINVVNAEKVNAANQKPKVATEPHVELVAYKDTAADSVMVYR